MGSRRAIGASPSRLWGLALLAVALGATLCLSVSAAAARSSQAPKAQTLKDNVVTVGSFDFAESTLLAELYGQALEGAGIKVDRAFNLGPRELVAPALAGGFLELVPEYAGTAVQFLSLAATSPVANIDDTHQALVRTLQGKHVTALGAAPAQDANTFVVSQATADTYTLRTLSDLTKAAPILTFGGPPECRTRPLCLAGLQQTYGMKFKEFVELDAGGPLTRQALRQRVVDVALLFSTDPTIGRDGFVELIDDRGLQPAENVTPLVRTEAIERFGTELVASVNAVSSRLTTDVLRDLNGQVASGDSVAKVAARWLESQGLS